MKLPNVGPDPLDVEIDNEPTEPHGHVDESGPLMIHEVYSVGREEEDSELFSHHGERKREVAVILEDLSVCLKEFFL